MTKNQIEPFEQPTDNIFKKCIQHIAEGITGIAAAEPGERKLSIGHILQGVINGKFLSSLQKEWQQFKENGRIEDSYEQTEQHRACLKELLEYLERGIPDERILEVLKRIFLIAATEAHSTRNDVPPQEYMKMASVLTSGEILLLESACRTNLAISDQERSLSITGNQWIREVANNSPLKHVDLINLYVVSLCKKHMTTGMLASPETASRRIYPPYYGLTELGYAFCEYINHYESKETEEAVRK